MTNIDDYRAEILGFLRQALDKNGNPRLDEKRAVALSQELSDSELQEGMDFNTPEEVAELLLESGL